MAKIGVTGHQNIPAAALPFVRAGIERAFAGASGGIVGLSSLAAGADQLFARALLDGGGQLHAIIPSEGYDSTFTDEKLLATYRELLESAARTETLPHGKPSQQAFLEAGMRVVDLADILIAVCVALMRQRERIHPRRNIYLAKLKPRCGSIRGRARASRD